MSNTLEKNSTNKGNNSTSDDKFDKLKFIRIFDPNHVPKYLIEQIKDRDYDVEKFYKYHESTCLIHGRDGPRLNPVNMLYLISNEQHMPCGVLWCTVSVLSNDLIIQTFSMDKDYWGQGKAVQLLEKKCREIKDICELNNVYWVTKYPKHSEKYGFKRSKSVLMEYTGERKEEENDGKDDDGGKQCRGDGSEVHRAGAAKDKRPSGTEHAPDPTSAGKPDGRTRNRRKSKAV